MKINQKKLKEIVVEIMKDLGEDREKSKLAADILVKADMRGISTHGTYLLMPLKERIEAGILTIPTEVKVIKSEEATTTMDGGNGIGQIAAWEATKYSIKKAGKFGIGLTLLKNTNNVGFLGYYTNLIANEGLIGFAGCNAAPAMAPWGGTKQFFGTNPISISVPTGDDRPIIVDMSSSVVARGKIRRAKRNNEDIPQGWALDAEGEPTIDPEKALNGSVLPIAGPKGSGLAMIVDILAGMLSGSSYAPDVKTFHSLKGATGVGAFFMAIDIERFQSGKDFYPMLNTYISSIKNMKKAKSVSEIYLPGELEFINEDESNKKGVEIDTKVIEGLNNILKQFESSLTI